MPTRNVKSNGLFSFGTGVAVGFGAALTMKVCLPKPFKLPGLILKKLGFDAADLFDLFFGAQIRAAWKKMPESTRRASGLRLEVDVPYRKRRRTNASPAVQPANLRPIRGRVFAGVN